ncbi:MAG: S-adenosylmethionine:tRNA ribosyltransferase-isomerase [Bdellovibrionales bacterium]|nr:S-adenosylmethionine:tRNA ribosyltransferase-isomerase [Bdellovibrionales bacterium]
MLKSELFFQYPEHLIATEKKPISRVMWVQSGDPVEVTPAYVLTQIGPDDLLVINETKVIPARIHSAEGMEILFIKNLGERQWEVLCPASRWPKDKTLALPGGVEARLVQKGLPQVIELNQDIELNYFDENGELPLPPYIQQARGERKARSVDSVQYQAAWAERPGSLAAPTASLHFKPEDLQKVKSRGADVASLCLHVGLGTFLPIQGESLDDHKMHKEFVSIPKSTWQKVKTCHEQGGKVWALGSTVTRALESQALHIFEEKSEDYIGETDLFIKPGFEFKVVDVLMTNFHQPESTLIAMVMAFAGQKNVLKNYQWAIERNFRLFSYGDLTVWTP